MADRHVIPDTRGWHVERDQTQRVSATTTAQADAVRRAVAFVTLEGGGRVVVHDADGAVLETHTVAVPGRDETPEVAVPRPREATPPGAASPLPLGRLAEPSPAEPSPVATPPGAGDTAPVRRAGRGRGADPSRSAGPTGPVRPVLATPGVGPPDPDDAARRIARATEHAALPLDLLTEQVLAVAVHVARLLNPVRLAGRSAGAVVAVGLGVAALAARRDPRSALPRSSDRRRSELRRR